MPQILIIEDEPLAANRLAQLITDYDNSIEIVAQLQSVEQVQAYLQSKKHPDLIFSDIELLDGSVFNAYKVRQPDCPVIFTTAYDHYMMDAFQSAGIAYILKPYDAEQISEAMQKYQKLTLKADTLDAAIIAQYKSGKEYKKRLVVKRTGGIELLSVNKVSLIKIALDGLYAYDTSGKCFPLGDLPLSSIEQTLDPELFFRINRNEIIAIEAINKVKPEGKDRLSISLNGQSEIFVCSAQKTPLFRKWLDV